MYSSAKNANFYLGFIYRNGWVIFFINIIYISNFVVCFHLCRVCLPFTSILRSFVLMRRFSLYEEQKTHYVWWGKRLRLSLGWKCKVIVFYKTANEQLNTRYSLGCLLAFHVFHVFHAFFPFYMVWYRIFFCFLCCGHLLHLDNFFLS